MFGSGKHEEWCPKEIERIKMEEIFKRVQASEWVAESVDGRLRWR